MNGILCKFFCLKINEIIQPQLVYLYKLKTLDLYIHRNLPEPRSLKGIEFCSTMELTLKQSLKSSNTNFTTLTSQIYLSMLKHGQSFSVKSLLLNFQ